MKRSHFPFLAATSAVVLAAGMARAATRPRYGGTLRVEMSSSVTSADPAMPAASEAEAEGKQRLDDMLFDRLVRLDLAAHPVPQLSTSWSHDADNKKWQFSLRPDAKLVDGNLLSLQDAASSLAAANPDWHVTLAGGSLVIETNFPLPGLPAELALARNSIVHRGEDGAAVGSGPFRVSEWVPGRRAVLAANDEYWGDRPYVDAVEIDMGRGQRDQLIDLELGKTDVIDIGIGQLRNAVQDNVRTVASSPADLLAIVFAPGNPGSADARWREALALSIDRAAIHAILLQKQGEPAGGLLPGWLSGYAFLFPAARDIARARQLRAELLSPAALTLGYDSADPLARAVAQRIALDARDAGLSLRAVALDSSAGPPASDARLARLRLPSDDLRTALAAVAESLHEPVAQLRAESASLDEFYEIERSLLADFRVIPLFHLPEIFALSPRVRQWSISPRGGWRPEAAWLETEKP
jgi:peptide/nickel transport system substrate-binding protein